MWAFAALAALTLAAPHAHAYRDNDCFAYSREVRALKETIARLKTALDKAPAASKPNIQAQISAAEAQVPAKSTPSDTCTYTLHVHAVRVGDSCPGTRQAAIDPEQVARWIAKANEVYAAARVRFAFDPTPNKGDWAELNSTEVNNLIAELPGDIGWERGKAFANELAAHYPDKVLLLFRYGPGSSPTGVGFSSTGYSFVALPGFGATTVCGAQNAYLFAHEVGHYFGLNHTFLQFKTKVEAAAALKAAGNKPSAFDADGLADTPPEPYIEDLQCTGDATVVLNGLPFALLRNNIMSYYASDTKTLTPQQIQIVRTWAERRFGDVLDGAGPMVPDERRTYQIVSTENGRTLTVENASKARGARVLQANWTGGANQAWKIVPLTARDFGTFEIVSVASGKCLTVEGASAADGARLVQWDWEGTNNQKWRFLQDGTGELSIEAKHSQKVLAVPSGSRVLSPPVQQGTDVGGYNQRWRLLPLD